MESELNDDPEWRLFFMACHKDIILHSLVLSTISSGDADIILHTHLCSSSYQVVMPTLFYTHFYFRKSPVEEAMHRKGYCVVHLCLWISRSKFIFHWLPPGLVLFLTLLEEILQSVWSARNFHQFLFTYAYTEISSGDSLVTTVEISVLSTYVCAHSQ